MTKDQRFSVNEDRYIVDHLNPTNSGKGYCHEGDPENEIYLRERVLMGCLSDLVKDLIINTNPIGKLPSDEEYQARHSVWVALLATINASHLNTLDTASSFEHKFDGTLKREKKGMRDLTSLSLFRDDIECLLRDLYGDIESEALDSVLYAVFSVVEMFTKYARADLCEEHSDAVNLDYMLGIGVPEGCGISSSESRRGMRAKLDLMVRAYEVRANPSAFSKYTVEFANRFGEHWMVPNNDKEFLEMKEEFECGIPW